MPFFRFASFALLALAINQASSQSRWLPYGPYGGDARSFAADPADHKHIFVGTESGSIYDTHNGGHTWQRLAEPGGRDDLAFDNLLVDPSNPARILAAGWAIDHVDGGLFISTDKGKTWASNPQLKGHSIRALTIAPSDPKVMIVGALDGVYRSTDAGTTWSLISPAGSKELHEVESIAIDPKNPDILYAGTWHLPWKTVDGGANWTNMKDGIIDDSDVFSIIVDPLKSQEMYLSACSGIYRSSNQGEKFVKVQGIPATARRTRVLMMDSKQTSTVFAGTTEGLWRTTDSGRTFLRNGDPGWIINDVTIDPSDSNHVLLATDRTGVLLSEDGGLTFSPSNSGFISRQISSTAQDNANPAHIWASVINDKAAGGVFSSDDGGLSWQQNSAGLGGADVFALTQAPDGTLLAGTRHGIFSMVGTNWQNTGLTITPDSAPVAKEPPTAIPSIRKAGGGVQRKASAPTPSARAKLSTPEASPAHTSQQSASLAPRSNTGVFAMLTASHMVFAATEDGLLTSANNGQNWTHVPSMQGKPRHLLAAADTRVLAADQRSLDLSVDHGQNFLPITMPPELAYITAIAIDSGGRLWVGGRQGVFYSGNDGVSWQSQKNLFVPDVTSLTFDSVSNRLLVTANQPSTLVYAVHMPDMAVTYNDSGWALHGLLPVADHLVGITPYDGVVLQPRMVVSEVGPYRR